MAGWEWFKSRRPARRERPPAESRPWVHPSELPSFEALVTVPATRPHTITPRIIVTVMAFLLIIGAVVLMVNRGAVPPSGDLPAHLASKLTELPALGRAAAANTVDLTIVTSSQEFDVAALVLPHDLAVTTTVIPVDAHITGTTAKRVDFPVTLVGRDNVMGFSIVHLGVSVPALTLDPMPASASVLAVAPIERGYKQLPAYHWAMTTLGDPSNNSQGVVRYLATKSKSSLDNYVDAIAIDSTGHVVAVLSSHHFWYPAKFVAQVAAVVATGLGCHADLGIAGKDEQGGGVLVTRVIPFSAAAHAGLNAGDVITRWNSSEVDTWNQLASTLYLTPAYAHVELTFDQKTIVRHANVTLGCPSKLVP